MSEQHRAGRTALVAYGKTVWSRHPLLVPSCRWLTRSNRIVELVGKKFKIPMGTARDIYYKENAWRQLFEAMPPESYLE